MICPGDIVWIYVDVTDCCKYITNFYNQYMWTCDYNISLFNAYIECVISHNVSNIILSFNQSKLHIVYSPGSNFTSKKLINISGCNIFEYYLHNQKGLTGIFQNGYVQIISYTLKPTRLWILLRKAWYQIQESRVFWWKGKPVFRHEKKHFSTW